MQDQQATHQRNEVMVGDGLLYDAAVANPSTNVRHMCCCGLRMPHAAQAVLLLLLLTT
jgi:hypothetical protein